MESGNFVWACQKLLEGKEPYYFCKLPDGREARRWMQLLGKKGDQSVCVEQAMNGEWASCGGDPFMEDYLAEWSV